MDGTSQGDGLGEGEIVVGGYLQGIEGDDEDTLSILRDVRMGHAVEYPIVHAVAQLLREDGVDGLEGLALVVCHEVLHVLQQYSPRTMPLDDLLDVKEERPSCIREAFTEARYGEGLTGKATAEEVKVLRDQSLRLFLSDVS